MVWTGAGYRLECCVLCHAVLRSAVPPEHVPACLPCPWLPTQVLEGLCQKVVAAYMPLLHRLVDSLVRHSEDAAARARCCTFSPAHLGVDEMDMGHLKDAECSANCRATRKRPHAQALLDMLAGFAVVASGTDAGAGSRQYVRPVLTEVGWAGGVLIPAA